MATRSLLHCHLWDKCEVAAGACPSSRKVSLRQHAVRSGRHAPGWENLPHHYFCQLTPEGVVKCLCPGQGAAWSWQATLVRGIHSSRDQLIFAALSLSTYGNRLVKCVQKDDQSALFSCAAQVLQNVEIEHPVGYLINSLVQAHHDTYHCGTKTLLATINMLSVAAQKLVQEGFSEVEIARGIVQGIQLCIENVEPIKLPGLLAAFQSDQKSAPAVERTEHRVDLSPTNVSPSDGLVQTQPQNIPEDARCSLEQTEDARCRLEQTEDARCSLEQTEDARCSLEQTEDARCSLEQTDDDIGWFFESGFVPPVTQIVEPIKVLLDHVTDISDVTNVVETGLDDFDSIQEIKGEKESTSDQWNQKCLFHNENANSMDTRILIEDAADGVKFTSYDEFDDCFNDIQFKEYDLKHPPCLQLSVKDTKSGERKKDSISEEKHTDKKLGLKEIIARRSDLQKQKLYSQGKEFEAIPSPAMKQLGISNEEHKESDIFSSVSLEIKLAGILSRKTKMTIGKAMNQSRHFKTVESAVAEQSDHYQSPPLKPKADIDGCLTDVQDGTGGGWDDCHQVIVHHSGIQPSPSHHCSTSAPQSQTNSEIKTSCETVNTKSRGGTYIPLLSANQRVGDSTDIIHHTPGQILEFNSTVQLKRLESRSRYIKTHQLEQRMPPRFDPDLKTVRRMDSLTNRASIESYRPTRYVNICETNDGIVSNKKWNFDIVTEDLYINKDQLADLVYSLGHGAEEAACFVTQAAWKQVTEHSGQGKKCTVHISQLRFEPNLVNTLGLPGPPSTKSRVVDGLVVVLSQENLALLEMDKSPRKALLINGDISGTFKHRGINKAVSSMVILTGPLETSRGEAWLQSIISTIEKLSVRAVVVKGSVDGRLVDYCSTHNIIVITHTPTKVLLALAEVSEADIATYIIECTKDNVVKNLILDPWCSDWMDQVVNPHYSAYAICRIHGSILQTAVICHPCSGVVTVVEDQFWHSAHRLKHVLAAGSVCHGHGQTEQQLAELLYTKADEAERSGPALEEMLQEPVSCPTVLRVLADGFNDLAALVQRNRGGHRDISERNPLTSQSRVTSPDDGHDWRVTNQDEKYRQTSQDNVIQPSTDHHYISRETFKAGNRDLIMYDDLLSKIKAWQSAAHIVSQLLLTDIDIVAGYGSNMSRVRGPDVIGIL